MTTLLPSIAQKIENTILLFTYKGKKPVKQTYTVDLSAPVKLNGTNEDGYKLNFYPENKYSYTCITLTDLLFALKDGQREVFGAHVHAIERRP
jgi:hypothetical protein